MKTSSVFTLAAVAGLAIAETAFEKVSLTEPLNWLAGDYLFPSQIIAGYHAELAEYTAETWAEHILELCKGYQACTSSITYQATNSGSTGGQYWFGYVFRGGPTSEAFYVRDSDIKDGVADSIAYTIVQ